MEVEIHEIGAIEPRFEGDWGQVQSGRRKGECFDEGELAFERPDKEPERQLGADSSAYGPVGGAGAAFGGGWAGEWAIEGTTGGEFEAGG